MWPRSWRSVRVQASPSGSSQRWWSHIGEILPAGVLTNVLTFCHDLHMTTNEIMEVRFTAKRASVWNNGNHRWVAIGRDKALELVVLGQAIDITGRSI